MRQLVERRVHFGERAPITEALIDIQCRAHEDVELDELRSFGESLEERFPTTRMQSQFESQIRVEGGQPSTRVAMQHAVRGYTFFGRDGVRVAQVRRDGFSFSRLRPYDTWDALRDEARELWLRYVEIAKPERVNRIAVRYINRIELPAERIELGEWFKIHPSIPAVLGPMEEFLVRVVTPHPDNASYRAITTQATQPSTTEQRSAIILDIDVFTHCDHSPSDEVIWHTLEDLRVFKNDVFFATATEKVEATLK